MNSRRWGLARTVVQLGALGMIASPLAGLSLFSGNLSAAEIAGLPLADPLAAIQVVLASGIAHPTFLLSAAGVTLFYWILGGRTFCGWVCPVYLVTESAGKIWQNRSTTPRIPLSGKRAALILFLVFAFVTGVPLFEVISPIGIVTRAILFALWFPLLLLVGIVIMELLAGERVWCRSLCPLGGWYSLVGATSPIRVSYARDRCTLCGECRTVCPVPEVLDPPLQQGDGRVRSGECTRCARCIDICPTDALSFGCGYSDKGGSR